jgi:hypothetical protein
MIERPNSESARSSDADDSSGATLTTGVEAEVDERVDRPDLVPSAAAGTDAGPVLLKPDQAADFERRWEQLQAGFVDQPGRALYDAEQLITDLMQAISSELAAGRSQRETAPDGLDSASTEDLRLAFVRYRSLFQRLISN